MRERNKKLEITSAIVGGIYTAVHVVVAIYIIIGLVDPSIWQLQAPDPAMASIIVVFVAWAAKAFSVLIAFFTIGIAVLLLTAEILPLCFKSTNALRVIAILTCLLLTDILLLELILFFGGAIREFRDGNHLSSLLTTGFLLLGIAWFVLNIIKSVIYKKKQSRPAEGNIISGRTTEDE